MIEDSKPAVVLTQRRLRNRCLPAMCRCCAWMRMQRSYPSIGVTIPGPMMRGSVNIIWPTSSTLVGLDRKPKGVMVEHRQVAAPAGVDRGRTSTSAPHDVWTLCSLLRLRLLGVGAVGCARLRRAAWSIVPSCVALTRAFHESGR